MNDLPDGILSTCKVFTEDTSRFSNVYDIDISAKDPNSDLEKVVNGLFIRKFSLILIPINRLNEVNFFRKSNNRSHPPVPFNSIDINRYHNHKHLGVYLDLNLKIKKNVVN